MRRIKNSPLKRGEISIGRVNQDGEIEGSIGKIKMGLVDDRTHFAFCVPDQEGGQWHFLVRSDSLVNLATLMLYQATLAGTTP